MDYTKVFSSSISKVASALWPAGELLYISVSMYKEERVTLSRVSVNKFTQSSVGRDTHLWSPDGWKRFVVLPDWVNLFNNTLLSATLSSFYMEKQ